MQLQKYGAIFPTNMKSKFFCNYNNIGQQLTQLGYCAIFSAAPKVGCKKLPLASSGQLRRLQKQGAKISSSQAITQFFHQLQKQGAKNSLYLGYCANFSATTKIWGNNSTSAQFFLQLQKQGAKIPSSVAQFYLQLQK